MSWERVHAGRQWGTWPSEEAVRLVSAAGRHRPLRVLDIGCGGGAHLRLLQAEGHRAVGMDIAPSALRRLRTVPWGSDAQLVQADAARLPFRPGFDLVLDVESLCYLSPADQALAWADISRVLSPQGQVLSIAFSDRCYPVEAGPQPQTPADGPLAGAGPTTFLDENAICTLVSGAGLRLDDLQTRARTVGPKHLYVEEWVVVASKAAG